MSRREHVVLRLAAVVVLALCAWLPRASSSTTAALATTTSAPLATPASHADPARSGRVRASSPAVAVTGANGAEPSFSTVALVEGR